MSSQWLSSLSPERRLAAERIIRLLTQIGANESGYNPETIVEKDFLEESGDISRFIFLRRVKYEILRIKEIIESPPLYLMIGNETGSNDAEKRVLAFRKILASNIDRQDLVFFAQFIARTTALSILYAIDEGHDPEIIDPETNSPIGNWSLVDEEGILLEALHESLD